MIRIIDGQPFVEDYALNQWIHGQAHDRHGLEEQCASLIFSLLDGTAVSRRRRKSPTCLQNVFQYRGVITNLCGKGNGL